jgi:hypothetical protein
MYFFDGIFNVVKFSKGMTIYHGSSLLANSVVEFPVGVEFYTPVDDATPPSERFISVIATTDESIEEAVSNTVPVTPGWYANPDIAMVYSGKDACKGKCVNAYKLKKDIVMFLLDDDYNIAKLLNTDWIDVNQKENLIKMFNLPSTYDRTIENGPFTRIRYPMYNEMTDQGKQRVSNRKWDIPFANFMCKNVTGPLKYSGYASPAQYSIKHKGEFHLEFIFCNAFKYLERDLTDKRDWQYNGDIQNANDTIKVFMKQMGMYKSFNYNWHAGDLLQHSVWSLLFAEDLVDKQVIWDDNVKYNNEYQKLIAFTAFIHDIGKMRPDLVYGNVKNGTFVYHNISKHSLYGKEYIDKTYNIQVFNDKLEVTGYIDMDDLFDAFNINIGFKEYVSIIVFMHWDFGYILGEVNKEMVTNIINKFDIMYKYAYIYLKKLYDIVANKPYINFTLLVYMTLIVSLADIKATQPYGVDRIQKSSSPNIELNKSSKFFPFIKNMPKKYRGGNIVKNSNLETIGYEFANVIYETAFNYKTQIAVTMEIE